MRIPAMTLLETIPPRALVVGAHADDAELSAGGTLAKWIACGCQVTLAVCSNGDAGTPNPGASRSQVAGTRAKEQHAAARALGITSLVMLGFADGALEDTSDFRRALVHLIREHRPHTVLTHEPHRPGALLHRDHRIAGTVVQDAVYPFARDPLHYPEQIASGLEPHKVSEVLLWETDDPNCIIDTTGFIEAQAAALSCHRSQLPGLPCGEHPSTWLEDRAREAANGRAFEVGESFRRLLAPA
jgi:LmbE family N-acetylglucosaminyl deacetylase